MKRRDFLRAAAAVPLLPVLGAPASGAFVPPAADLTMLQKGYVVEEMSCVAHVWNPVNSTLELWVDEELVSTVHPQRCPYHTLEFTLNGEKAPFLTLENGRPS